MFKSLLTTFYPEAAFGGFTDVDGTVAFYFRVRALLKQESIALDIGCGRGANEGMPEAVRKIRCLRGSCQMVVGIDVDTEAPKTNPCIDEFRPIVTDDWPVESASIDLCIADNVLEHLSNPDIFFQQCTRVLKPGGYLCIRTPNVFSYFGVAASLIPNRHHVAVLAHVQKERKAEDVFPVVYRCNTVWRMRRALARHGFEHCVYGFDSEPDYLSFSKLFYFAGVLHQKYAPHFARTTLLAFARKLCASPHSGLM